MPTFFSGFLDAELENRGTRTMRATSFSQNFQSKIFTQFLLAILALGGRWSLGTKMQQKSEQSLYSTPKQMFHESVVRF